MSNFFYKFNFLVNSSRSNSFKFSPFLIFLTLMWTEGNCALSGGAQDGSSSAGGDRVHAKIYFKRGAGASPSAVSAPISGASAAVTGSGTRMLPQKRPISPSLLSGAATASATGGEVDRTAASVAPAGGEYVVGVIRGIPTGGLTLIAIIPPAAAAGGVMPGVPLLNIFNAAPPNDFTIPVVDPTGIPPAPHGVQLIFLNNPDHVDRLGYGNNQIIFRIWVPHGMSRGAAFREAIRAALAPPAIAAAAVPAAPIIPTYRIYFSGGRDFLAGGSAAYFSAAERRHIAQRVYENRYANQPISLPENLHPGLHNSLNQGRFRYNPNILLDTDEAFDCFWHTEPKFLYRLLNGGITPREGVFLHNILAISKYPMCGLCTRLLLNCLLNDGEMGRINPADHDGHFNIIIVANDLIGLSDTQVGPARRINNAVLNNNILSQAGVVLDNIGNLRIRLEGGFDPGLYTGANNWFMVLGN